MTKSAMFLLWFSEKDTWFCARELANELGMSIQETTAWCAHLYKFGWLTRVKPNKGVELERGLRVFYYKINNRGWQRLEWLQSLGMLD